MPKRVWSDFEYTVQALIDVYSEPHETIDKEEILPLRFWCRASIHSVADKEL